MSGAIRLKLSSSGFSRKEDWPQRRRNCGIRISKFKFFQLGLLGAPAVNELGQRACPDSGERIVIMKANEESEKNTSPTSQRQTLKINPDALFQRLENGAVLLHMKTDRFYNLNRTGARFWELLNEGHDLDHVQEQMLKEFDVEPAALEKEIKDMIVSLQKEDLLS